MPSFVNKLVGKILKIFLKNYTERHLTVDILRGDVVLKGVEINEKVLGSLLKLPPNLEISKLQCGFLKVHVPWRKLRSESVQVQLEVLIADIVEIENPGPPQPMPEQLAKLLSGNKAVKKKKKPKQQQNETTTTTTNSNSTEIEAEKTRKAIPGFIETIIEGISVKIQGVYVNISLLGAPEDGNWKRNSPNVGVKRRLLPPLSLRISSLSIESTNNKWEQVGLAIAQKEGRKNGEVIVWKEVKIGAITVTSGKDELFRLHPSVVHVTIRRKSAEAIPTDINIAANFPQVAICFNGNLWERTLDTLEDILWCLNTGKQLATKFASTSTSNTQPPSTTSTPSSQTPPSSLSPAQQSDQISETTTESESETVSEMTDQQDIDIAGITRDLDFGSETGSATTSSSIEHTPSGQQIARNSNSPLIQFNVELERLHVKWPGIVVIALTGLTVSSTVEKVPIPNKEEEEEEEERFPPSSNPKEQTQQQPQQKSPKLKKKRRHILNTLMRCSVSAFGLTTDPGAMNVEEDPSVVYFRGESGLPFIDSSFMLHKAPPGVVVNGPTAELTADVAELRFIPNPSQLKRLLVFFSGRMPNTPPSKSNIADSIHWLDTAKFRVSFSGIMVDMQVAPGGPRICFHVGPLTFSLAPSPLSPLPCFPPPSIQPQNQPTTTTTTKTHPQPQITPNSSLIIDESADQEPNIEKEKEEPKALFALQHCELSVCNIWAGLIAVDSSTPFYFFSPFQIEADLLLFQPITLLSYALQGRQVLDIDRGKFKAIEEMPAIQANVNITPIDFAILQSKLHIAQTTYKVLADLLVKNAETRKLKQEAEKLKRVADAAKSGSALQRRLKILRKVINARMAERIPCRAMASLKLAKTGLVISCAKSSLEHAFDIVSDAAETKITQQTYIDAISTLLFGKIQADEKEDEFAYIAFEQLEGSVKYQPPPLPTLATLLSAEMQQSNSSLPITTTNNNSSQVPLIEAVFAFHGYSIRVNQTDLIGIGVILEPRRSKSKQKTTPTNQENHEEEEELISAEDLRPPAMAKVLYSLSAEGNGTRHRIVATLAGVNVTAIGIPPPKLQALFTAIGKQKKKLALEASLKESEQQIQQQIRTPVVDEEKDAEESAIQVTRIVDTQKVTIDLELADMDVQHVASMQTGDNFETFLKFVPQTTSVLDGIKKRISERIASVEERRLKDLAGLDAKLQVATTELQNTERMLVEMKMTYMAGEAKRQEQEHECVLLRKKCANVLQEIEKLQAENARCYSMLKSKFSDVAVNEFRAVIRDLSDKGSRLSTQRDDLMRETIRLKECVQKAAETQKANEEQRAKELAAKEEESRKHKEELEQLRISSEASKAEVQKLKEQLEVRSQQLFRVQEALGEKQIQEEEIKRLRNQIESLLFAQSQMLIQPPQTHESEKPTTNVAPSTTTKPNTNTNTTTTTTTTTTAIKAASKTPPSKQQQQQKPQKRSSLGGANFSFPMMM